MTVTEFFGVLRRRKWAFTTCLVTGIIGGLLHTHLSDERYQATSRVIVNIPASSTVTEALAGAQLSRSLLETYAAVASSREVAAKVRSETGPIEGSVEAVAQTNTFLIDISATSSSPAAAAELANVTAQVLAQEVDTLEAGRSDPVRVAPLDPARPPDSPVYPIPARDILVGLAIGLLGGAALVALLDALDRSISSGTQAARLLDAPLLGSLPRTNDVSAKLLVNQTGALAESLRTVRTAVRFLDPDQPPRVLLITSANEREGKTTTATALALSLAHGGESVVLVDADMRRAALSELVGLERAVGLSSVVVGTATLDDALQAWQPNLAVLTAGATPPNAAELCGSQAMAVLIQTLAERFDAVVVDGPPVLPVTDPVVLAPQVDGVIVVVRHGRTTSASAVEAARRLKAVGGRVLGVVHNGAPGEEGYYAAPYYGNRASQPAAAEDGKAPAPGWQHPTRRR